MVSFIHVEETLLHVPSAFKDSPAEARLGLVIDDGETNPASWPEVMARSIVIFWPQAVDWPRLLSGLSDLRNALPSGSARFAWLDEKGRRFRDFSVPTGDRLAEPFQLDWAGTDFSLILGGASRIDASDEGVEFISDSHAVAFLEESSAPGQEPKEWRLGIEGKVQIRFTGEQRGSHRFILKVNERLLEALGAQISFFSADELWEDEEEVLTAGVARSRFPIFHLPEGSDPLALHVTVDPLAPFDTDRSFWTLPTGEPIGSHFETILGHAVALRPLRGARFVFDRAVTVLTEQGEVRFDRTYLTPDGAFELFVPGDDGSNGEGSSSEAPGGAADDWPDQHALVLGISASEYVTFRPHRGGISGDRMLFHARRPAIERVSLPRIPAANRDEPSGAARVLSDVATTSWISFAPGNPGLADDGPALVSQPAELELFADLPSAGLVPSPRTLRFDARPRVQPARQPMPLAPFLGSSTVSQGVSVDQDIAEVRGMESNFVAVARQEEARLHGTPAAGLAPEERATPHGFPVTLEGDRWHRVTLASTPPGLPDFGLYEMNEPATRALTGNRTFLVATRFGERLAKLADELEIANWRFVSDIDQESEGQSSSVPPDGHDLLPTFLFKYHDLSIFQLLGLDATTGESLPGHVDQENWTAAEDFNENWKAVRAQLKVYLRKTILRHLALGDRRSPYGPFLRRLRDPAWNGMMMLNTAIVPAGLPLQVQGLLAGINEKFFRGHHVGLDLNQLGQEGFEIERSSLFGVVDYPQPETIPNPEPLDPERRNLPPGTPQDEWPRIDDVDGEGRVANFQVEYLRVQFENSEIRRFDCRVKLWMEKLFREQLPALGDSVAPPVIAFDGKYERRTDSDGRVVETYSFAHEREYIFDIDSSMIDSLTINKLQMTTVEADDRHVLTRFSFWGALAFQKIGDFDLFGIKSIEFGDLGLDLDFDLSDRIKRFLPRLGSIRFELPSGGRREGSFLGNLPFRLKFFQFGDALSLSKLGYFKFDTPNFGTDLFDFGLGFDIDLGSLGALAKKLEGLRLETLFGWLPKSDGERRFAIGFKLKGTGGGGLDLGIEGVLKLVIEKLKVEALEVDDAKLYAIQAVNTRLEVLGQRFPDTSELKLFMFVDPARLAAKPSQVSEMAWLAVLTDSSGGDGFQLPLLALGQRVNAYPPGGVPSTRQVTDHIAGLGRTDDTGELVSILTGEDLVFAPEREWTVALRTVLWNVAAVDLVFLDPDLYGIRLRVPGSEEQTQLFAIDVLYRKITDDLGVYSVELAVPDAWRQLEFGYFSLTLPIIGLDLYTNGDFLIDVGFPWDMDFSRSCTVQMLPFLGGGGFYYARLEAASSNLVPVPRNPRFTYDPVVQLGFGARIGLGKEFRKGILRAGLSVSVFGILEGARGELRDLHNSNDDSLRPPSEYLVFAGTVGILGEVFGHVDFGIVKAGVSIRVWIAFGWVMETYHPLILSVEAGVRVRVRVVIGRIKIFGKTIKITISFSFSARLRFEWTLGKGDLDRWNSLFRPPSAGLTDSALQADLGPVRCLDWIEPPRVFEETQTLVLRFTPDVAWVNGSAHTVALLTIAPEFLRRLGRALVLWAGARWAANALDPSEHPFSIHDLRHLEACLACPRSLARGETSPGGEVFAPLDAQALATLFGVNFRFRIVEAEEVAADAESANVAVFPFFSHLSLSYQKDGGAPEVVELSESTATRGYLDRLDAGFEKLRILLEERGRGANLADDPAVPFADFLLEDYCHLLMRQTLDAVERLLASETGGEDPNKVGQAIPLATLLDRLDEVDEDGDEEAIGWGRIGEATSRFYLHGLRIPALDGDMAEEGAAEAGQALFAAAGLQRQIPPGGEAYGISVAKSGGADWLSVDSGVGEVVEMGNLSQFPAAVPLVLEGVEVRSPIRPRARRYALQTRTVWKSGSERRSLWNLPPALRSDLRRRERAFSVFEAAFGALDGRSETAPLSARWATRLTLRLERLPTPETVDGDGVADRPVYRVLPLGETERRRLDRLVDAPEWLAGTEAHLVFSSSDGAADAMSHRQVDVSLWRTDLSTEPKPAGLGLTGTASDDLLVRADLDQVADFITLLRRASLVRSGGYFLSYRGGDADLEPGLPSYLFESQGGAELSLLLLHPSADLADPVSAFADSVVLSAQVGDAGQGGDEQGGAAGAERKIVYARASSPSLQDDYDFDLPFAPGTVGFRAYRRHPAHLPEAQAAVAESYHLLEYEISKVEKADGVESQPATVERLHSLTEVLPVAPREVGEDRPGEEPRDRPPGLAADDWCYEHIVPAHKLLAGPNASPYAAVGETLRVALGFRDPYGNRAILTSGSGASGSGDPGSGDPESGEPGVVDIDVRYIDRLLSPTDWPSMLSTWDVDADEPGSLQIQLRFDPRGFYADRRDPDPANWRWLDPSRDDEEGRAAAERLADLRRAYGTVRQQLEDERVTLRLAASFNRGEDLLLDATDRDALIELVDEILEFLAGLPASGEALPTDQNVEPPGRRWMKSFAIEPTEADFEELRVSFQMARPAELVDDRIGDKVPEVTAVAAPVEAALGLGGSTPAAGEEGLLNEEPDAGLVAFAERFERAFPALALAVGAGSSDQRVLWAVRRTLAEVEFTHEEAGFFAIPPLSTRLASGQVTVPSYGDLGLGGGRIRVADVDLDQKLRETFSDVERFLEPHFGDRVQELGEGARRAFERVIRAKNAAAEILPPKLHPVYREPSEISDQRAVDLLEERMKADLREGYDVDTVVVVPMKVAQGSTSPGRPPVAYGELVDRARGSQGIASQAPSPAESRRLSTANLPLAGGEGLTYLVFALDSKRETRAEIEALSQVTYRLTHIERRIDEALEDRDTAWLQLVKAQDFKRTLPDLEVPVPLRQFPDLPRLEEHGGRGGALEAADFSGRLKEARQWGYEVSFEHPFVDQDAAYLEVLYNSVSRDQSNVEADHPEGADEIPRGAFGALVAYHHHRDALWARFGELSGGQEDENARLAVIFADLIEAVVRSLRPQAALDGGLIVRREIYRIDVDLARPDEPDGRRRVEITRTLDSFGGDFAVRPRQVDGEPYDVRDEPSLPDVDHRVVSYQPALGEDAFRPQVRLDELDVLEAENAWAGLFLRRNERFGRHQNSTGRAAAEAFVYETPPVRFGEAFTPTLDRLEPFIFDGQSGPIGEVIESLLETLFSGVIPSADDPPLAEPLRVDMRWGYESGRLGVAIGQSDDSSRLTVRPPHPIANLPAYEVRSAADAGAIAAASADVLGDWLANHRPIESAHLVADLRVYGRNVRKPVLRLRRLAIPVAKIGGEA